MLGWIFFWGGGLRELVSVNWSCMICLSHVKRFIYAGSFPHLPLRHRFTGAEAAVLAAAVRHSCPAPSFKDKWP